MRPVRGNTTSTQIAATTRTTDWREGTNGLWSAACGWPDVGNIVWGGKCGFKKPFLSEVRNDGDFFHDIYDTAMTNQGTGEGELDGMRIVSNRTDRCEQSYEYWFTNPGYKVGTIEIRGNEFEGAGFGWSHEQRPNKNATHILSYSVKCPKGRIILDGNRFGATKQRNVWHMGDGGADWIELISSAP